MLKILAHTPKPSRLIEYLCGDHLHYHNVLSYVYISKLSCKHYFPWPESRWLLAFQPFDRFVLVYDCSKRQVIWLTNHLQFLSYPLALSAISYQEPASPILGTINIIMRATFMQVIGTILIAS